MIILKLKDRIGAVKTVSEREKSRKEQKKNQDIIERYNDLLEDVLFQACSIMYAERYFSFVLPDGIRTQYQDLLNDLKRIRDSNQYTKEGYQRESGFFAKIKSATGKAWTAYYEEITADTVQTLENIREIGGDGVKACLQRIRKAKEMPEEEEDFADLHSALQEAAGLVEDLNIQPEVSDFLLKMKNGQARFTDLTEPVLQWIHEEGLESRIKLSFTIG